MNKLLQYHVQVNAMLDYALKQLRLCWLSLAKSQAVPEFDPRTQYDIGMEDCRPPQSKPVEGYSTSLQAMLNRTI